MVNTSNDVYEKLSKERKELIVKGLAPDWYITAGWSLFKQRYLWAENPLEQYKTIASTVAKHYKGTVFEREAESKFFDLMWRGLLSPSTPALANTGSGKGMPVSCAGQYIEDSVYGFFDAQLESAVLTQMGFGTAGYFGDIRPRGSEISGGGKASGSLPILLKITDNMQLIKQNKSRRGAFAGYLPVMHGDFDEWANKLHHDNDKLNIGWIVNDEFIKELNNGNKEALRRYQKILHIRSISGKGYLLFIDKVNRARPRAYINNNLYVTTSQLCDEIRLFCDKDHTFTCVLSSLNLANYSDKWKSEDVIFWSTIFLHGVALEFLKIAEDKRGFERAVRFTEKSMALGLGVLGLHTYFQKQEWAWGSLDAQFFNERIFKEIKDESIRASKELAKEFGEPEWAKGTGMANTHLQAVAPTKSTSIIMGGVSEGINPDAKLVFNQSYGGGEVKRIIPEFLRLLKNKGMYNDEVLTEIRDNNGSIQGMDKLFSSKEQSLFKTAFEINQFSVLRYTAQRQKHIDQGQSANLFIKGNSSEEFVSSLHQEAFTNEDIHGLYYIYSTQEGGEDVAPEACEACEA